jgi:D-alanine-D-alanine ligase
MAEDAAVLVEERIAGVEVTGAVVERPGGEPEALPLVEIVPKLSRFFDFASKYQAGAAEEIVPARVDDAMRAACQAAAVTAHRALGCRGFSRTDMIVTDDGPVVLELNTIPGLTPQSLLPKAAAAAGLSFPGLVERLVASAVGHSPGKP